MNVNILTKEDVDELEAIVYELVSKVNNLNSNPEHIIFDNKQLQEYLSISDKGLQRWRDSNTITYSVIGRKFYYKLSDVKQMLDRHKVEAIK